jgi:signal transduction histidine kinase
MQTIYDIVKAQGGSIGLGSSPEGSEFIVSLPA